MSAPKMTDERFLSVLQHELQSSSSWAQEHLQEDQLKNLQYYLGMPLGNEIKGRSQVTSWDVFEAVESALPGFIEPFFAGDYIGQFKPRTPADEAYAEQATDYVNYLIRDRNDGFLLFLTWFKDALLSKVGVVRVDWEEEEPERMEFRGLLPDQLAMIQSDGNSEIIEHKQYPVPGMPQMNAAQAVQAGGSIPMLHDVTVLKKRAGCVDIDNVRPENFIVTSGIGEICDARLIGEWAVYTRSELREMGFKQAGTVQSYDTGWTADGALSLAREDSGVTNALNDDPADETLEEVRLFSGYMKADRNGDGIAEWRRVLIGSGDDPILLDEEADDHNYAIITPIPIPHRVIGLAYADVARPIHELKTALTRQYLDSLYQANRPRTYVNLDAQVSLDDMLSDRIGGIIRGRGPAQNAVQPLQTTAVSRDALEGLQLADTMRETRLGIPKFNPGLEADALHKTATGVRSINNLVDKRQKMTLRIMAETGVRRLFKLVLKAVTEYQDAAAMVRLRDTFVPFDPRGWSPDMDVHIEVGVGTSDETETMAMLQQFWQFMQFAMQSGTGVVQPKNVYEFGKALAKNARLKGADARLLTDPTTLPPPRPQPDPKLAIEQFKAQQDAMKFQAESQIEQQRRAVEAQLQMAQDKNRQEMEARQKQLELQQQAQLRQMEIAAQDAADQRRLEFERWKVEFQAVAQAQLEAQKQSAQMAPQIDLTPLTEQMKALAAYVMAPPKMVRQNGVLVGVEKGGRRFAVSRDASGIVGIDEMRDQ